MTQFHLKNFRFQGKLGQHLNANRKKSDRKKHNRKVRTIHHLKNRKKVHTAAVQYIH